MTDPSLGRKNKKITYTASPEGISKAERALKRLGFESKSNFAKSQLISRSTVTNFFQRKPIQLDSFKRICEALKLNWREIAELTEKKQPNQLPTSSYSTLDVDVVVEQVQLKQRQVTVIDKQSKKIKAVITLEGDVDSVQNWKIIQSALRVYSGDTIEITDIKEGSIRLFVEGSPKDIERLVSSINSGELKTVRGFPVEDVQILSESSDDESTESDEKWRLVQEIVSQTINRRRLSGVDLSDTDLSSAYLRTADLSDADLRNADLSGADLVGADLRNADLRNADLIGSYLISADLSDADLRNADLSDADLRNADLSRANIDEVTQLDSKWCLVWQIVNRQVFGRDLSKADLKNANLSGADLIGANLIGANLSYANLIGVNLSDANLIGANLSGADLIGANLSGAELTSAIVTNALFVDSEGLTENMRYDLERRGAIFGDRPPVLNPK
ncbi:pentapeptide repeat-containing protein [Dendronalium sp. ChiSLP03b]|uniref:pentapeptide repeat-containing protein n=1 Tax=Dendronalium sp. ChiSLP03b TaxID=3075381 RepID=UPI00391DB335